MVGRLWIVPGGPSIENLAPQSDVKSRLAVNEIEEQANTPLPL